MEKEFVGMEDIERTWEKVSREAKNQFFN